MQGKKPACNEELVVASDWLLSVVQEPFARLHLTACTAESNQWLLLRVLWGRARSWLIFSGTLKTSERSGRCHRELAAVVLHSRRRVWTCGLCTRNSADETKTSLSNRLICLFGEYGTCLSCMRHVKNVCYGALMANNCTKQLLSRHRTNPAGHVACHRCTCGHACAQPPLAPGDGAAGSPVVCQRAQWPQRLVLVSLRGDQRDMSFIAAGALFRPLRSNSSSNLKGHI